MIKQIVFYSLISLVVLSTATQSFSQTELVIEPTGLAVLNNTINGDTLPNGERTDPNRVYILRRNGVYKINTSIFNPGFKLVIRAEEGEGAMPVIQPTPIDGGDSFRPFNISSEFEMEGVYVTNIDDIGNANNRTIRVNTGTTVRLKNCWLDGTSQSVVRFDAPGSSVFFEDCIISHVGETFDTGNGRIVDVRGTGAIAADSIVFRNNTIFNISRRLVRHSNDLSTKYLEISNNTLINSISQLGTFEQTLNIKIVDNLFVNPNLEGGSRTANLLSIDPFVSQDLYSAAGIDPTRRLELHHNWFYFDQAVTEVWADTIEAVGIFDGDFRFDLVDVNGQFFNDTTAAEEALSMEPYFFEGPITFRNAPRPSRSIIIGVVNDGLFALTRDEGTSPNWNYATSPFFQIIQGTLPEGWEMPYDFTYDSRSPAATAASDGGPIGSRQWTPALLEDIIVGREDPFMMDQSYFYPNPAREYIHIKDPSRINSLVFYSSTGLEVKRADTIDGAYVDVSGLGPGVYILRVTTLDNKVFSHRLIKN